MRPDKANQVNRERSSPRRSLPVAFEPSWPEGIPIITRDCPNHLTFPNGRFQQPLIRSIPIGWRARLVAVIGAMLEKRVCWPTAA
jgi:hypothetical protein